MQNLEYCKSTQIEIREGYEIKQSVSKHLAKLNKSHLHHLNKASPRLLHGFHCSKALSSDVTMWHLTASTSHPIIT